MIQGHLSTELAAALPREVMDALGLLPGDAIEYVIDGDGVRISRPPEQAGPEFGLPMDQLRTLIREALDDPRPPIPAGESFERVRTGIAKRRRDGV